MAISLQEIANEIKTQEPHAVIEIDNWANYIDIWTPTLRYNIAFGEAVGGYSYNDDQGFGYGDFIDDLPTAKEIVTEFFKQVTQDTNLTYEQTNKGAK